MEQERKGGVPGEKVTMFFSGVNAVPLPLSTDYSLLLY